VRFSLNGAVDMRSSAPSRLAVDWLARPRRPAFAMVYKPAVSFRGGAPCEYLPVQLTLAHARVVMGLLLPISMSCRPTTSAYRSTTTGHR